MRKMLFIIVILVVLLSSCSKTVEETFTVTFDSNGGSAVSSQEITSGEFIIEPSDPTLVGYVLEYWHLNESEQAYVFSTPVTADLTLIAKWERDPNYVLTDQEKLDEDIASVEDEMFVSSYELELPLRGTLHNSTIKWTSTSEYISSSGFILPVRLNDDVTTGQIQGEFSLNGIKETRTYDISLSHMEQVEIATTRVVPFTNLTTEYTVEDADVNLYFEQDGYVPYIKIVDFFSLLEGFIDPDVEFTFTKGEGTLEIFYQYYDEDYDETYDLIVTFDTNYNTITTNDPGFYWAYVSTIETNHWRHIEHDSDNPDASFVEGENIIYDLDDYSMDMAMYDDEVLIPYYIANQLFASPGYYNVYYNYEGLFGVYFVPEAGGKEYRTIKRSEMNDTDIPADLLVHTFNMMAFDLDNFYGLKDIMEIDTYYELLFDQKEKLLNSDPEDFEYAIRDVLLKQIDDPHTSYGYPSYFNRLTWSGPEINSLTFYGTRFQAWYYDGYIDVDDAIGEKWGINSDGGWNAYSPNRPNYWFLDDVSVLLSLDDFNSADIEESASYDASLAESVLKLDDSSSVLPVIGSGSKFFFYNNSTETNNHLEILAKGLDASYVDTYAAALIALGYEYKLETTTAENKLNGYYQISVPSEDDSLVDVFYMVQIAFDEDLGLFYVGIIDKIPDDFGSSWPFYVDIFDTVYSDSAVYMEMMFDQILAIAPDLENVMLDLSWNTGGWNTALFRVVGFITDEPFRTTEISRDTGGSSSRYVIIDGVPNYSNLNWALLVTPVTYSAGNEMATIFKENDLGSIIGKKSGGGACSVTPILLPNGTAFIMSSNNMNGYREGTGTEENPFVYYDNEFGVEPDYPINIDLIYDINTLLQVFPENE